MQSSTHPRTMTPSAAGHGETPIQRTVPDDAWEAELAMAEVAIDMLLNEARRIRREDFRLETLLWQRHHARLWAMKRKLDAVVM